MHPFHTIIVLCGLFSVSIAYDPRFAARSEGVITQGGTAIAMDVPSPAWEPGLAPVYGRHSVHQRRTTRVLSKEEMKVVLAKQRAEEA